MSVQGLQQGLGTVVVEAHPIQGRLFLRQTEQARARVAGLTMPGDRAHLGKTEPESIPDPSGNTVLVESSRQANRIGKAAAEQHLLQTQVSALQIPGQPIQHRGHHRPAAALGRLGKGRQGSTGHLFRIQSVVIGQHRPQPALIEGAAAQRGRRHRRGSGLF